MLGIVILNYKTYEVTKECVDSILETYSDNCFIYIVDNDSDNDSVKILTESYEKNKNVNILQNSYNAGFAKGNNFGINKAIADGCKYIIVTNNDIIFKKNSIAILREAIEKNNNAVIIGPQIEDIKGELQISYTESKPTMNEYVGLKKKIPVEKKEDKTRVYSVSGCCFIINGSLFRKMGAFDEGTFLYAEESIYSYQAKCSGYEILYFPQAKVIHKHAQTAKAETMNMYREFLKSSLYFWRKYEKVSIVARVYIWCVITIKCIIKTIFNKDMRFGWCRYLKETWKEVI